MGQCQLMCQLWLFCPFKIFGCAFDISSGGGDVALDTGTLFLFTTTA